MLFIYACLGISVLTLLLFWLACMNIVAEFRKRYPEMTISRKTTMENIFTVVRMAVVAFIPFINLALLWVVLFNYEELEERTIVKIYLKCLKDGEKNSDL